MLARMCCRRVSVCPFVCHKPVFYRNDWTNRADFCHGGFLPPIPHCQAGAKVGRHYRRYGVPADAINVPADSASEIVKFTISIPHESCTNAKAKYSSSVVPPDPSVHFYHWL